MTDYRNFANLEFNGTATNFRDDIHTLFKTLALLEVFSHEECSVLCEYLECYGAPSNTTILTEGDDDDFLVLVLTGSVNVIKQNNNEDVVVANIGPGEFLGEMSLVDGKKRSASCKTLEPTDFAVLTRDALNEILIDHPRLGNKFLLMLLQLVTGRLREATNLMLPMLSSHAV